MGFKKGVIQIGLIVLVLVGLAFVTTVGISASHKIKGRPFSKKPIASPPVSTQPSVNPISWKTPYASLEADDFYIELNGKRFVGSGKVTQLSSSPPFKGRMTLERVWKENDVQMRFFVYFSSAGTNWKVDEIRTYSGESRGEWVFYPGFDGTNFVSSLYKDNLTLNSSSSVPPGGDPSTYPNIKGTIYFKNLKLSSFLQPTGCASENPSLSLESYSKLFPLY